MNRAWQIIRAVRGPIVLIVAGVLFALEQSGWLGFERSWPVLIILIGALKLIERLIAPPAPPPPPAYYPPPPPAYPGPGTGGVPR